MPDTQIPLAQRAPLRHQLVDIGGRRLAMVRTGSLAPCVILETGLGAGSDEWELVQRGIEEFAQVMRYDRAGRGCSDPAATPRTGVAMAEDLHALIQRAELPGPFVLVGHSFGGLIVRLFAQRYPSLAAGLVLVDSLHEDQFDVVGAALPAERAGEPPALSSFRRFWTGGWRDPAATAEGIDMPASLEQGRRIRSLGDLPLQVLSAGRVVEESLMPDPLRQRMQSLHDGLQLHFLRLSPRAEYVLVRDSGHFIQRDAPQAVVDAVRLVVERIRRRQRSGTERRSVAAG